MVLQASSRLDVATSVRSYQPHDVLDIQECIYYTLEKLSCNLMVQTPLLYKFFTWSFNVVNF
jgi:hypothetical protein